MEILNYPFDAQLILRTQKKIRRELLGSDEKRLQKKITILGGSTTEAIRNILELFLLDAGIEPVFYQSDYNRYWQEVLFDSSELYAFAPDIIFIHTTARNISQWPELSDSETVIDQKLAETFASFCRMWDRITEKFHCPIIQNNFDKPWYRLMGNRDVSDIHGHSNFVSRLNTKFYEYAQTHSNFYINDIDFLSSSFGLQKWNDPMAWYMYKTAPALAAVPELAFSLANIIKSIYGKNKKALVLDLDNTLWGGIIREDGAENIEIGQETPAGQMYSEFQSYLKSLKNLGVLLNIDSKNDKENALDGLNRPDSVLKPDDFTVIKANWQPKDRNLKEIAEELNIGTDTLVFVDDNPAERHIIRSNVPDTAVPEFAGPEEMITTLDRSGFFEATQLSEDDLKRSEMYKANAERQHLQQAFTDYNEYLRSLEMHAEIRPFSDLYMARIAQLTNKSNQFNLTTLRCTEAEIRTIAADPDAITLYGKLTDRFGDNGVVSVLFGHRSGAEFHIDLWLMSCRVLKRGMEFAMMDALADRCLDSGIKTLRGYYYPTKKNAMVKEHYAEMGFSKISEDENGNTVWELDLSSGYRNKNEVITIEEEIS